MITVPLDRVPGESYPYRSAVSLELIDSCLIFVPFGHDDEPEILRYEITSICPISADVKHAYVRQALLTVQIPDPLRAGYALSARGLIVAPHQHPT